MPELERNKQIAVEFLRGIGHGEPVSLLMDEKGIHHTMGDTPISGIRTRSEIPFVVDAIREAFPDGLQIDVIHLLAEGDHVAVEAVSDSRHVSGKRYRNSYHFLFHIRDGKILMVKEYMDTKHVMDVFFGEWTSTAGSAPLAPRGPVPTPPEADGL